MNRQLLQYYERFAASWLPSAASAVFVVLTGWALAGIVWAVIPTPESARWTPPPVSASPDSAASDRGPDVAALVNAHLFGEYTAPTQPVAREVLEAPETRLDLTLTGILAATENRGSRALIAQGKSDEEPYGIDDLITRGVTLKSIFADRVILSRDGQLETLRLDKDKPSSFTPASYEAPVEVAEGNVRTITGTEAYELAQIRETLLADPSQAANYLRVQPARIGGEMRGYRIYPGRNRQLFSTAGLRPGDLVTGVNGVNLDDPGRALQLLGDLSTASSLSVTVERGGNQQTINVNLN